MSVANYDDFRIRKEDYIAQVTGPAPYAKWREKEKREEENKKNKKGAFAGVLQHVMPELEKEPTGKFKKDEIGGFEARI